MNQCLRGAKLHILLELTNFCVSIVVVSDLGCCVCHSVWIANKAAKQFTLHSTRWYASGFALRQRMLNFVQNFQYYMMVEVIEPNWAHFESNLQSVSKIDHC